MAAVASWTLLVVVMFCSSFCWMVIAFRFVLASFLIFVFEWPGDNIRVLDGIGQKNARLRN